MLKKLPNPPKHDITWQGEVVATVRGLSPADVTAILVDVGEDIAALFNVQEELEQVKLQTKDASVLADQLLAQWPKIFVAISSHFPNVMAKLIARAADADDKDTWMMVRDEYSVVLQMDILAEIARLTFNDPEGFRRFVGNVLALVDLTGTLTSKNKKRPLTRAEPPSLGVG